MLGRMFRSFSTGNSQAKSKKGTFNSEVVLPAPNQAKDEKTSAVTGASSINAHPNVQEAQQHQFDNLPTLILEYQLLCQPSTITKEYLYRLIELYSRVIEGHAEEGDFKHKQYTRRLQEFLSQGYVSAHLKGSNADAAIRRSKFQEEVERGQQKVVKTILDEETKASSTIKHFIEANCSTQDYRLQTRLEKRRKGMSFRGSAKTTLENEPPITKKLINHLSDL